MLAETIRRGNGRIVIAMPPRHGKSQLIARWLPLWFLVHYPHKRIVLASYAATLAEQFSRQARDTAKAHSRQLGITLRGLATGEEWETAQRGGMLGVGVNGSLIGKGADLLIIDDPYKNAEEALNPRHRKKILTWWRTVAKTRLHPGGTVIVQQHRWHRHDLAGTLLDAGWTPVITPALAEQNDWLGRAVDEPLWPERYDAATLADIRAGMTPYWWSTLYQQQPTKAESAEFPAEWLEGSDLWFDAWPLRQIGTMAVDPSKGRSDRDSDYTAIVRLAIGLDGLIYAEALQERYPTSAIADAVINWSREFRPDAMGCEANQFQELLADQIATRSASLAVPLPVWPLDNTQQKAMRIRRLTPYLARRQIRFRDTPGTRLLVQQLRDFPLGEHDDGPDALEMAIRMVLILSEQHDGLGDHLPIDV